ncbi:hypothetical protein VST7929_02343 [Vibrio stylophorae]|uniref:RDD domain-containing protein n=1 Tax=Vibrio stylophorae TaxID=659351 RepID=A0ABN8DTM4_9VIBR|nr:RDD family protein [Vibrio stylophorae]CAH0534411.1 hypothetical protein VST7929_02343 [Vibrio stylophorae]
MFKQTNPRKKNAVDAVMDLHAGFVRRILAMIYDAFLVAAIALLASGIGVGVVYLLNMMGFIELTGYQDISDYLASASPASSIFALWLCLAILSFYLYFLTKGGQTLGMRAWKIKLINARPGESEQLSPSQILIRLTTAAFGLGNLICLFDSKNRAFQDYWAETKMVQLDK